MACVMVALEDPLVFCLKYWLGITFLFVLEGGNTRLSTASGHPFRFRCPCGSLPVMRMT